MALSIKDTLLVLKKNAISNVIQNLDIKFETIKKRLNRFVIEDSGEFSPVQLMFKYKLDKFSSSLLNGIQTSLFIDFYSLYIITFALDRNFQDIRNISNSKYNYISNLWKDALCSLRQKEGEGVSRYSFYYNFSNKNSIISYKDPYESRNKSILEKLSMEDGILSLPCEQKQKITFDDFYVNSSENSEINKSNTKETFNIDIYEDEINKIFSTLVSVKPLRNISKNKNSIFLDGSVNGVFINNIFVKVTNLDPFKVKCSTSGSLWSDDIEINENVYHDMIIERNINPGIKFLIKEKETLKIDDGWILTFKKIKTEKLPISASFLCKNFDNISYIKFDNISNSTIKILDTLIKHNRFSENISDIKNTYFDLALFYICNDSINELTFKIDKKNASLFNHSGRMRYKSNISFNNVFLFSNTYISNGALSFGKNKVEDVSSIFVSSTENIKKENIQKDFIEYSLLFETESCHINIPCLTTTDPVNEIILLDNISANSYISYSTRFPVKIGTEIKLNNLNSGTIITLDMSRDKDIRYERSLDGICTIIFSPNLYDILSNYSLSYTPYIQDDFSREDYIKKEDLYYLYYLDFDNNIKLKVRFGDSKQKFSGDISSAIEMHSVNSNFISPYIFDYRIFLS